MEGNIQPWGTSDPVQHQEASSAQSDVERRKVYMCGLPSSLIPADVSDLCYPFGNVEHCNLIHNKRKPNASALITMSSIAECQEAISALNGKFYPGTDIILTVRFARGRGGGPDKHESGPVKSKEDSKVIEGFGLCVVYMTGIPLYHKSETLTKALMPDEDILQVKVLPHTDGYEKNAALILVKSKQAEEAFIQKYDNKYLPGTSNSCLVTAKHANKSKRMMENHFQQETPGQDDAVGGVDSSQKTPDARGAEPMDTGGSEQKPEDNKSEEYLKLFIAGLNPKTTEETLKNYFEQWGDVEVVELDRNPGAQKSRGFGFVTFKEQVEFEDIQEAGTHIIDGHQVFPTKASKEKHDAPTTTVIIEGIPPQYTMRNLTEMCERYVRNSSGGKFPKCRIAECRPGQVLRSATVTMDAVKACKNIIKDYNGKCAPGTYQMITIKFKPRTFVQTETTLQGEESDWNWEATTDSRKNKESEPKTMRKFSVHISGLPIGTTWHELKDALKHNKDEMHVSVLEPKFNQTVTTAFVHLSSFEACERFVEKYDGQILPGTDSRVRVKIASRKGDKQEEKKYAAVVSGLPADFSWTDFKDALQPTPDDLHVTVVAPRRGNSTTIGIVYMASAEACDRFVRRHDDSILQGTNNRIKVDRSSRNPKREGENNDQRSSDRRQSKESGERKQRYSLFVTGIPIRFTWQKFKDALQPLPDDLHVRLLEPQHNHNSKSGFVRLDSREACERFTKKYDGQVLKGTDMRIRVKPAKTGEGSIKEDQEREAALRGKGQTTSRDESEMYAVYMTGVPNDYTQQDLKSAFQPEEHIMDVDLLPCKAGLNLKSRAAFVKLDSFDAREKLISNYDGTSLPGTSFKLAMQLRLGKHEEKAVYIYGLPMRYSEQQLEQLCRNYGNVVDVKILPVIPGFPGHYACVKMHADKGCAKIFKDLNLNYLPGTNSKVQVSYRNLAKDEKYRKTEFAQEWITANLSTLEEVEIDQNTLQIRGLPARLLNPDDVCNICADHGSARMGHIVRDAASGQYIAYVKMCTSIDCRTVILNLDGTLIPGCTVPLTVKMAEMPSMTKPDLWKPTSHMKRFDDPWPKSGKSLADKMLELNKMNSLPSEPSTSGPNASELSKKEQLAKLVERFKMVEKLGKLKEQPGQSTSLTEPSAPRNPADDEWSKEYGNLEAKKKLMEEKLEALKSVSQKMAAERNINLPISQQGDNYEQQTYAQQGGFSSEASTLLEDYKRKEEMLEQELQRKEKEIQLTMKLKLLKEAKDKKEQHTRQLEFGGEQSESSQILEEARKRRELLQEELRRKENELMKQTEEHKHLHLNRKLQMLQEATFKQDMERKQMEAQTNAERLRADQEEQELQQKLILLEEQNKKLLLESHLIGNEGPRHGSTSERAFPVEGKRKRKSKWDDAGDEKESAGGTSREISPQLDPKLLKLGDGQMGVSLAKQMFQEDSSGGMLGEALLDQMKNSGLQNMELLPDILEYIGALPLECLRLLAELPVEMLDNFCKVNPMQLCQMAVSLPELNSLIQNINLDQLINCLRAIGAEGFHTLTSQFSKDPQVFFHMKALLSQIRNVPSFRS